MSKLYEFKEDGYWNSIGCDCCPGEYIESYYCTSHNLKGRFQAYEDDCYLAVLQDAGVVHEEDNSVYNLSLNQLKCMCADNDIMVVIYD